MNVVNLKFALSNEDNSIINKGLRDFSNLILIEHDLMFAFGYCGRSWSADSDQMEYNYPKEICGILHSYVHSSPNMSELWEIFNLEVGNGGSLDLSTSLNICIAVIIHTIGSKSELLKAIIFKIIREYSNKLISQLESSEPALIHSSLAVMISIVRTSSDFASEVYQRLLNPTKCLKEILQNSKNGFIITEIGGEKKRTSSRHLLLILLFLLVRRRDSSILEILLSRDSIVKYALKGMSKDTGEGIMLTLRCVHRLIRDWPWQDVFKFDLIDVTLLKSMILLYSYEEAEVVYTNHALFLTYCRSMGAKRSTSTANKSLASASGRYIQKQIQQRASYLVKLLSPHENMKHREVRELVSSHVPKTSHKYKPYPDFPAGPVGECAHGESTTASRRLHRLRRHSSTPTSFIS